MQISFEDLHKVMESNSIEILIKEILEPEEEIKPIRGYNDYWISSKGRVISTKGRSPRILSTWANATSESLVELQKNGEISHLSTKKLRSDHYDDYMTPLSAVEDYLIDQYGDDPEILEWVDQELAPLIKRRKPDQKP